MQCDVVRSLDQTTGAVPGTYTRCDAASVIQCDIVHSLDQTSPLSGAVPGTHGVTQSDVYIKNTKSHQQLQHNFVHRPFPCSFSCMFKKHDEALDAYIRLYMAF